MSNEKQKPTPTKPSRAKPPATSHPNDVADRAIADAIDGATTPIATEDKNPRPRSREQQLSAGEFATLGAVYAKSARSLAERSHRASANGQCDLRSLQLARHALGHADAYRSTPADLSAAREAVWASEAALSACLRGVAVAPPIKKPRRSS